MKKLKNCANIICEQPLRGNRISGNRVMLGLGVVCLQFSVYFGKKLPIVSCVLCLSLDASYDGNNATC